jgi:hypothetical protein
MFFDFAVGEERVFIEQAARMVGLPITPHGAIPAHLAQHARPVANGSVRWQENPRPPRLVVRRVALRCGMMSNGRAEIGLLRNRNS